VTPRGTVETVGYADALAAIPDTIDGQAPLPVPDVCPVTLDELLSDDQAARSRVANAR
jgi:hypothetical protein